MFSQPRELPFRFEADTFFDGWLIGCGAGGPELGRADGAAELGLVSPLVSPSVNGFVDIAALLM